MTNQAVVLPISEHARYTEHPPTSFAWNPYPGQDKEGASKKAESGKDQVIDSKLGVVENNVFSVDRRLNSVSCLFCGAQLSYPVRWARTWSQKNYTSMIDNSTRRHHMYVKYCRTCGWWRAYEIESESGHMEYVEFEQYYEGIIFGFDLKNLPQPIYELRKQLVRRERTLSSISPREFEVLVGSVLRDFFDCRVHHIGGPSDGGADLLLVEGDETTVVQCKRRLTSKSEPVRVVRSLLGTMLLRGVNRGIIATTAPALSKQASLAVAQARAGCTVEGATVHLDIDVFNQERIKDALALTDDKLDPWRELLRRKKIERDVELRQMRSRGQLRRCLVNNDYRIDYGLLRRAR